MIRTIGVHLRLQAHAGHRTIFDLPLSGEAAWQCVARIDLDPGRAREYLQ